MDRFGDMPEGCIIVACEEMRWGAVFGISGGVHMDVHGKIRAFRFYGCCGAYNNLPSIGFVPCGGEEILSHRHGDAEL